MLEHEGLKRKKLLSGVRFDVYGVDYPRRSGGSSRREVVVSPDAVVVVPVLADGRVVMIRNERFAVGRTLWELPAGMLEAGEDPAACAGRELLEETGYRAGRVESLTGFYTSPGFCTERMLAYVGRELTAERQALEETERIEVFALGFDEVMELVRTGEVEDGKTIAALLFYARFGGGEAG